jgi:hypothetical protein
MARSTLLSILIAIAGVGLGAAGLWRSLVAEDAASALRSELSARSQGANTGDDVRRLAGRVDALEARLGRLEASPAAPATASAVAQPEPPPADPGDATDAPNSKPHVRTSLPSSPVERAERRQKQAHVIETFWKRWGTEHGLSQHKIDELAAIESEATQRKLQNQEGLVDGLYSQKDTHDKNQAVTEDVRARAKALLSSEEFARFEADKGAEWGASYRHIRDNIINKPGEKAPGEKLPPEKRP